MIEYGYLVCWQPNGGSRSTAEREWTEVTARADVIGSTGGIWTAPLSAECGDCSCMCKNLSGKWGESEAALCGSLRLCPASSNDWTKGRRTAHHKDSGNNKATLHTHSISSCLCSTHGACLALHQRSETDGVDSPSQIEEDSRSHRRHQSHPPEIIIKELSPVCLAAPFAVRQSCSGPYSTNYTLYPAAVRPL